MRGRDPPPVSQRPHAAGSDCSPRLGVAVDVRPDRTGKPLRARYADRPRAARVPTTLGRKNGKLASLRRNGASLLIRAICPWKIGTRMSHQGPECRSIPRRSVVPRPRDTPPCEAEKGSHAPACDAITSDPAPYSRQLALRDVLAAVSDDPGGAIPPFISEIPVRPVFHAACAAARRLSALHPFAHELRRFAVPGANGQPPVRAHHPHPRTVPIRDGPRISDDFSRPGRGGASLGARAAARLD